jgi:hypothetical protein
VLREWHSEGVSLRWGFKNKQRSQPCLFSYSHGNAHCWNHRTIPEAPEMHAGGTPLSIPLCCCHCCLKFSRAVNTASPNTGAPCKRGPTLSHVLLKCVLGSLTHTCSRMCKHTNTKRHLRCSYAHRGKHKCVHLYLCSFLHTTRGRGSMET